MLHRVLQNSKSAVGDYTLRDTNGGNQDGVFEFKSDSTVNTINFDKPITIQGEPIEADTSDFTLQQAYDNEGVITLTSGRNVVIEGTAFDDVLIADSTNNKIIINELDLGSVNNVEGYITDLSGRIDTNTSDITTIQSQQTTQDTSINNLTTQVDTNTSDIETIQSQQITQDTSINSLSTQVAINTTGVNANASNIQSLTNTRPYQTGLLTGGDIEISPDTQNRKFNIQGGSGLVKGNYVSWSSYDEVDILGGLNGFLRAFTHIYIDINGDIFQSDVNVNEELRRDYIYLGKLVHNTVIGEIQIAFTQPEALRYNINSFHDFIDNISNLIILDGCKISPHSGLSLNISQGHIYGMGINYFERSNTPNMKAIDGQNGFSFSYRLLNGTQQTPTTSINPNLYDNGVNTSVVGNNKWTNQRIYIYPSGTLVGQYGQFEYNQKVDALNNLEAEQDETNNADNAVLLCVITIEQSATDFTNGVITTTDHFGDIGQGTATSGSANTTTLQQAYDNDDDGVLSLDTGKNLVVENESGLDLLTVDNANSKVIINELDVGNIENVETYITDLSGRVDTNTSDIATNTSDIATNTSDIATNTSDIAQNTSDINEKVSKSGDQMSGQLILYTANNTTPLKLLKLSYQQDNEYLQIGTGTEGSVFSQKNNDDYGLIEFRMENTDGDFGSGYNIRKPLTIYGNATNYGIVIGDKSQINNNYRLYNTGNTFSDAYYDATGNLRTQISSNASNITTLTNQQNQNTAQITTNTANITTNAANISSNEAQISTNTSSINTNFTNISSNTSDINTNSSNISQNTSDITQNTSDINTNSSNISQNTSDINTNSSDITNLQNDKVSKSGDIMTGTLQVQNLISSNSIGIGNASSSFGTGFDDGWLLIDHDGFNGVIGSRHPNPEGGILFTALASDNKLQHGHYMGLVKDVASTSATTSYRLDFGHVGSTDSLTTGSVNEAFTPTMTIDGGGKRN